MARIKQTVRMSTGGGTPRKQLANPVREMGINRRRSKEKRDDLDQFLKRRKPGDALTHPFPWPPSDLPQADHRDQRWHLLRMHQEHETILGAFPLNDYIFISVFVSRISDNRWSQEENNIIIVSQYNALLDQWDIVKQFPFSWDMHAAVASAIYRPLTDTLYLLINDCVSLDEARVFVIDHTATIEITVEHCGFMVDRMKNIEILGLKAVSLLHEDDTFLHKSHSCLMSSNPASEVSGLIQWWSHLRAEWQTTFVSVPTKQIALYFVCNLPKSILWEYNFLSKQWNKAFVVGMTNVLIDHAALTSNEEYLVLFGSRHG